MQRIGRLHALLDRLLSDPARQKRRLSLAGLILHEAHLLSHAVSVSDWLLSACDLTYQAGIMRTSWFILISSYPQCWMLLHASSPMMYGCLNSMTFLAKSNPIWRICCIFFIRILHDAFIVHPDLSSLTHYDAANNPGASISLVATACSFEVLR